MQHIITRLRHELKRRRLTVKDVIRVTPNMLRIVFGGDDMEGFTSTSPDDHVKLFFPIATGEVEARDYTPRKYDADSHTLAIDFAIHEAGPAAQWAVGAKGGDLMDVAGPKGSTIVPNDFDWFLLVGDESALPSIGRRVEEMPSGVKVISIIAVTGPDEEQHFETQCDYQAMWVHRPRNESGDPAPILTAMKKIQFPEGDGYVWIAGEANIARAARDYIVVQRGHPLEWLKAAGYWIKGRADAHEKF